MQENLSHYVKHFSSFLSKEICEKTIKELNTLPSINWNQHVFYDSLTKEKRPISGEQELSISYSDNIYSKEIIMEKIWHALNEYMIYLNFNWYNSWSGYSTIRFNKYSKNTKMAKHCDHIHTLFDGERKGIPVLSVLGLLNDDYVGGDFIMFENKKIELKHGDLLIFPSIFLYPHKVEPVTQGIRYSFISWVW
jgi:hypothetical protein